jgi:hypothetical protein
MVQVKQQKTTFFDFDIVFRSKRSGNNVTFAKFVHLKKGQVNNVRHKQPR